MNVTLSRSDVLKPLAWLTGILGTMTVAAAIGKSPSWLLCIFAVFFGMAVCLYFGAYVYCLLKDRDALRSETYSLHKMAIEHGVYGDSRMGLQEIIGDTAKKALAAPVDAASQVVNS